uniref:trypsin n=1 Tax=Mola mola TaxID=94237 RepID=A0A3Q3X688_MOLML
HGELLPVSMSRGFWRLLMVRYHIVSGWGKKTTGGNEEHGAVNTAAASPVLRKFSVPIIQNSQCSLRSQFNFTDNMLCRGDDGSPLVTLFGSTHFLTGVVGWGRGCPHPGYYGIYTNMANFVDWVNGVMATANQKPMEKAAVTAFDMPEQKLVQ